MKNNAENTKYILAKKNNLIKVNFEVRKRYESLKDKQSFDDEDVMTIFEGMNTFKLKYTSSR